MGEIHVRDVFEVRMPFVNENDEPTDPELVRFKFKKPDGTILIYVWGDDDEVKNPAVGTYTCSVLLDQSGFWSWRVEGEGGDAAAADEKTFVVAPSVF